MTTLQIEMEDELAAKLKRLGPDFVSNAIRNALWELEERETAAAYARQPDSTDVYVEPEAWEATAGRATRRP